MCYSIRDNIGDSINPLIVERIMGFKCEWADALSCQTSSIGSGLSRYFFDFERRFKSRMGLSQSIKAMFINEPLQIWSAGFIRHSGKRETELRKNTNVASVRGELSKKRLEKALQQELNITTGDGGLLSAQLLKEKFPPKYRLGIIPHIREIGESAYEKIRDAHKDNIIIDVRLKPDEFLKLLSQCEFVISSSLHGLIISDSFNIPNRQVTLTDRLVGDGFKFEDYYSSFGLLPNPLDLNKTSTINENMIIENYHITKEMVDQKKAEIRESFFRYI